MGHAFKPGASLRTHHFLAASSELGWHHVNGQGIFFSSRGQQTWLFLPAVIAGTCKSIFLLINPLAKTLPASLAKWMVIAWAVYIPLKCGALSP